MTLMRERKGKVHVFRNLEYYPMYLLFPKEMLVKGPPELVDLPRCAADLFRSNAAMDLVESDHFALLIMDGIAWMVWHFIKPNVYMEIYSGYEPAWLLAHCPLYWVEELEEGGYIPPIEKIIRDKKLLNWTYGYTSMMVVSEIISRIVPRVMEKLHMHEIMKVAEEYRCFEDFDYRDSREKQAFFRDWYHTRTRHPMISLEDYKTEYAAEHHGEQWDPPDGSQSFENEVDCRILAEQFMETLDEKDKQILQLRLDGCTLEEVADRLGYSNHSGVAKRLRKIGLAFEKFADVDYGFDGRRILSTY